MCSSNSTQISYLSKKSKKATTEIYGSKLSLEVDYGGLGNLYFTQLAHELDKFLQVDTVTGMSETKGTIRCRSIQLAMEMQTRGVVANDIILILSKNCPEQTVVVLATLFLGAIVAPLDPDFSYKECLDLVSKLKPKMYFCDCRTLSVLQRIFLATNMRPGIVVNFGGSSGEAIHFSKMLTIRAIETFRPFYVEKPNESVAFILPTQGTTGGPKLICLSHQNILIQTKIFVEMFNSPDKVISFFPLSWIQQTVLMCVTFDTPTIRILPGTFKEKTTCKIIHDFGVGHAIFGTDLAIKLLETNILEDYDLHCLKVVLIEGVDSSRRDIAELKYLMPHVKFLHSYGLIETGYIAAYTVDNYAESWGKRGSVGRICPNSKVKIVDIETKRKCGPGELGECYFHGDGMMLGYFQEPEMTMDNLDKGYFKTGDMAEFDDEGWLYVKGRISDLILRPGPRIIYPSEIENIILGHPLIKDVAVLGNDKEIVACVIIRRDKNLPMEKILRFVQDMIPQKNRPTKIVIMDNFPRTSIGITKKRHLKHELLDVNIAHSRSVASIGTN